MSSSHLRFPAAKRVFYASLILFVIEIITFSIVRASHREVPFFVLCVAAAITVILLCASAVSLRGLLKGKRVRDKLENRQAKSSTSSKVVYTSVSAFLCSALAFIIVETGAVLISGFEAANRIGQHMYYIVAILFFVFFPLIWVTRAKLWK